MSYVGQTDQFVMQKQPIL